MGGNPKYYKAMSEVAKAANSQLPTKKLLRSITRSITKAMNAAACSIVLLDSARERPVHASSYGLSDWYFRNGLLEADPSLRQVLGGEMVSILDASRGLGPEYTQLTHRERIASILGVPLVQRGQVIGALLAYTRDRHEFSRKEREFLTAVANAAVIAVENSKLCELAEHRTSERAVVAPGLEVPRLTSDLVSPPIFAHPSEEDFARLLDFYRIEWLYEPRSFPLCWEGERAEEMFTPDFYLPELNLYVELTTLKQGRLGEKNRKVRRLKELYPQVNIKLLNKKDYLRLLAKYGYGPLGEAKVQGIDRILFSNTQIQRRVRQLGRQISRDYAGKQPLLIGILRGMVCFMADLMRHITLPLLVDFMAISYYAVEDSGVVKITKDLEEDVAGLDVLMVEDIVDTGMTLNYILSYLSARNPASLRVCTLLDKRVRRLVEVPLEYVGFEVPDEFVVGYGLDYQGEYRNLPFIGVLHPEMKK
jgi:hypoxanthine phosphoribosyltransferase